MPSINVTVAWDKSAYQVGVDPAQSVDQVLTTVVSLVAADSNPADYCLRFMENDELVTDVAIHLRLKPGDALKLVPAPHIEAPDFARKANSEDAMMQKITLFSLQNRIKEYEFASAFVKADGLLGLKSLIMTTNGNTLAYALAALCNFTIHPFGWDKLEEDLIVRLINILGTENMVNICRPATAIIIKLINANPKNPNSKIQCYGFDVVYAAIQKSGVPLMTTMSQRLRTSDYSLQVNSLSLLNTIYKNAIHASSQVRGGFVEELYTMGVRLAIFEMMMSCPSDEKELALLEFQSIMAHDLALRRQTPVEPGTLPMLGDIDLNDSKAVAQLGCVSPIEREMNRIGMLGIDLGRNFQYKSQDIFDMWMNLPEDGRPPFFKVSNEILDIICDCWNISAGYSASTSLLPHLVIIEEVHCLLMQLSWRILQSKERPELKEAMRMLRSEIRYILKSDPRASKEQLRELIEKTNVAAMRERSIKEFEEEDEIIHDPVVRTLRELVYQETLDFVREQRFSCLRSGAWFLVPSRGGKQGKQTWRFCRLSGSKRTLHYGDYSEMSEKKPSMDQLKERLDLSKVNEIRAGLPSLAQSASQQPTATEGGGANKKTPSPIGPGDAPSAMSISLMASPEMSLLDLICPTATQFSEWTDGFNFIMDRGVMNKDTVQFIQTMADIQVRLRLLDITADKLELQTLEAPPLPPDTNFYYENVVGIGGAVV